MLGLIIGIVIGTVIAAIRVMPKYKRLPRVLDKICQVYVGFFRGTPMVVQLLLFYYVLSASAADIAEVKMDILSSRPMLPRTPKHSLYCVSIAIQEGECKLLMLGVEERHWRIT